MKTATIFTSTTPGWLEVVTPYDPEYLDDMKLFIPYENRRWVPETKSWRIRANEGKYLKQILTKHHYHIIEDDTHWDIGSNLFDYLFEGIPDEYVNKVYYALANALHPDHGGSTKQMQDLNAAYENRQDKKGNNPTGG
jgi:hypothetical protein